MASRLSRENVFIAGSEKHIMTTGISYVSIAVADMQQVSALWIEQFGLAVLEHRLGPDAELAKLWGITPAQISEQLLLASPGAETGKLHFVELADPGSAVRQDAAAYDLGAKNLDVNCTDLPGCVKKLKQAGYEFRSEIVSYEIEGLKIREVQMPAHDGLNVAFVEVLGPGFETPFTEQGYAALTSFVVIVEDTVSEADFYKHTFGFDEVMYHKLSGPGIETTIGLPSGAALHMRLCGKEDNMFGRMELISYEGLTGKNRFKLAQPPATGILRCGFVVNSLDEMTAKADINKQLVAEPVSIDTIFGHGQVLQIESPAGLKIDMLELNK
jgi:catechol 2,3-dioxygenase-like lactoylglutathione lyase family enzyme